MQHATDDYTPPVGRLSVVFPILDKQRYLPRAEWKRHNSWFKEFGGSSLCRQQGERCLGGLEKASKNIRTRVPRR